MEGGGGGGSSPVPGALLGGPLEALEELHSRGVDGGGVILLVLLPRPRLRLQLLGVGAFPAAAP